MKTPVQIGMVLSELRPAKSATPSLFPQERQVNDLSHAMDEANREFGTNSVFFGAMFGTRDSAPTRISFTRIPEFDRRIN